jgi:hypothetical protein
MLRTIKTITARPAKPIKKPYKAPPETDPSDPPKKAPVRVEMPKKTNPTITRVLMILFFFLSDSGIKDIF